MTTKDYRKAAGDIRRERVAIQSAIALGYAAIAKQSNARGDALAALRNILICTELSSKMLCVHFEPFGPMREPKFKRGGIDVRRIGAEPIIPTRS